MPMRVERPDDIIIELDERPVPKRIGLIALATDHTSEPDFARICDPSEVGIYVNRIAYENPTTKENLLSTGPRLSEAAAMILPEEPLDVVAFGCTAASVVLGDETAADYIRAAKPQARCVTPTSAAFAAFEALKLSRVNILTPYTPDVTEELIDYFTTNGMAVSHYDCLGFDDDREMARIKPSSIMEAARNLMKKGRNADALFISCTGVRAAVCAAELERLIEKPVITSNQAIIWQSLRQAGIERTVSGYGQLFTL